MTTALTAITDRMIDEQAAVFAEDLPDHSGHIDRYAAAGLSRPEAFALEAHAAKIISAGRRTILEMGRELLQAREVAKHGTWGPFLQRCGLEERTAQNYMRVAEQFGDKPEMISALPATALYALAAPNADPEIVEGIVEEVEHGARPTVQEVKERLSPPPLPAVPADLVAAGWSIKRGPHGQDGYVLTNARHGAATPPLTAPEVFARARELDTQLARPAQPPQADGAAPEALPPILTPLAPAAPTQTAGEVEIASATLVAQLPLLTPLQPAGGDEHALKQAYALLAYCRALTSQAQKAWDALSGPYLDKDLFVEVTIDAVMVEAAARTALAAPGLKAQAAMLAMGATLTMQAWDTGAAPTLESEGVAR
jgi:hypothetical protein